MQVQEQLTGIYGEISCADNHGYDIDKAVRLIWQARHRPRLVSPRALENERLRIVFEEVLEFYETLCAREGFDELDSPLFDLREMRDAMLAQE